MKPSVDRRIRRAARPIESLEPRCLLSATVIAAIPSQDIQTAVGPSTINLGTYLNDPQITGGTVVEIQTTVGNIPLQLTDSKTPQTVANFVQYINSGEYANTIIHRSIPGFIIQGGGFYSDGSEVQSFGNIPSEAGQSNVTGSIAIALSTGPDSGNTNWFINLANNNGSTAGNPNLDNSSDGGPFTVFGNVIDGGMTVVNAIAALQTVNDQQNSAFSNLPVQNYSGSTTPATVDPANMINTNTVIIPAGQAAPQYSVVSSNPSVISASVTNGVLTLTPGAGLTQGSATITATVTDLAGETASSSFAASINGFDAPITVGTGGVKSATYTDANGTIATVSLKGPGSASVDFHSNSMMTQSSTKQGVTVGGSGISITDIATTGTTGASVLTITTRGGTRTINLGSVNTQDLKAFSAKGVALTGSLAATGSIGALNLNAASGGQISLVSAATISVAQGMSDSVMLTGTGTSLNKFVGGAISGGTWTTGGSVTSISAASISGWTAQLGGAVTSLASKGDISATVNALSIGTIKAKGNLANSVFELSSNSATLRSVAAGGSISGSTINAAGTIGNVTALSLVNSEIYAAVGDLAANNQVLPNVPTDFTAAADIGSVRLKSASGDAFSNSDIAAVNIGKLSLGNVQTSNGMQVTGIASENIKSFVANFNGKKISVKNVTLATDVTTVLINMGVNLGDFVIKLF